MTVVEVTRHYSYLANRLSFLYIANSAVRRRTDTILKKNDTSAGADLEASGGRIPDKRQRILEAAIEVFSENGFFNSRVSEVAARAGVADGTIYLYFKSKDHILREALDGAFARFFEEVKADIARHNDDPREQLRAIATHHLRSLAANRNLAIVIQTELRQSAKFIKEFSHQHIVDYLNLVREIVRQGQAKSVFRKDIHDRIVANCFFGALDEIVTSWVLSERPYDLPPAADAVTDLMLHGMAEKKNHG